MRGRRNKKARQPLQGQRVRVAKRQSLPLESASERIGRSADGVQPQAHRTAAPAMMFDVAGQKRLVFVRRAEVARVKQYLERGEVRRNRERRNIATDPHR